MDFIFTHFYLVIEVFTSTNILFITFLTTYYIKINWNIPELYVEPLSQGIFIVL